MRLSDTELIDRLAAEYALGTLTGGARRRFENIARVRPTVETAILRWHGRLAAFDQSEEQPLPETWEKIQRRLGWENPLQISFWDRMGSWRGWVVAGTLAVAGLVTFDLYRTVTPSPEDWQPLATLESPQKQTLTVLASSDTQSLWFIPSRGLSPPPGKSFQVWWIAPGQKPVSAGVLSLPDRTGEKIILRHTITAAHAQYAVLAISIEPQGGSPTGQPTGEVIYQGKLIHPI